MAPITHHKVDVAIIGGGPAGLAAASSIRRRCPSLRLQVFERGPSVPKKGAALALYSNGVAALTSISRDLAAKLWSRACTKPVVSQVVGRDDGVLAEMRFDWGPNKPEAQGMERMMAWYELTQTLYEDQPEGTVHFNHQLTGLQLPGSSSAAADDCRTARLTFANGAVCDTRLVLGCDGLRSPVRQLCMPGAPAPVFQGMVTLRGRIATRALQQLPSWRDVVSRQYMVGGGHHAMVYSATDEMTVWVMTLPYSTVQERGVAYQPYGATRKAAPSSTADSAGAGAGQTTSEYDAQGALGEAFKLADLFAPSLLQVLQACDPESVTMTGAYSLPLKAIPEGEFCSGMVTLLGDAVHSTPVGGHGANLAIEDGAVLAYYLQKQGLTEAALRAYEADRAPRWRRVAEHIYDVMSGRAQARNAQEAAQTEKKLGKGGNLEYVPEVHSFQHPCLLEPADVVPVAA